MKRINRNFPNSFGRCDNDSCCINRFSTRVSMADGIGNNQYTANVGR